MTDFTKKLALLGCDTAGALERLVGSEELLESFTRRALDDPAFDGLTQAIGSGDIAEAFELAHGLKGMLGNLGLTPLYKLSEQITEPLRHGSDAGTAELCRRLISERDRFRAALTGRQTVK